MFDFPASTEFGKRIPKQKFYIVLQLNAVKRGNAASEQLKGLSQRPLNLRTDETPAEQSGLCLCQGGN